MLKLIVFALVLAVSSIHAPCAFAEPMTVIEGQGKKARSWSSLVRKWYLINDSRIPLKLTAGSPIPAPVPDLLDPIPTYAYETDYQVDGVGQAVRAYEVRFLIIDAFGEKQRLLSVARLLDVDAHGDREDTAAWHILSNQEAQTALYSIGYVAKVLTAKGEVIHANTEDVLKEIQKIQRGITISDLEPE